jgi:DNA-directed RNA polymerase subunit K/omega
MGRIQSLPSRYFTIAKLDDPVGTFILRGRRGEASLCFLLVTIAATREKKKARRAAEEGFEIKIGPPKLTRFEKARIVGARSLQLAMGAPAFVPIDETTKESIALAMTELASEALPISIRRSLPNGVWQDIPVKYLL